MTNTNNESHQACEDGFFAGCFLGGYNMTAEQKTKITELRKHGKSYKAISDKLGISVNTIKSYCQRHHLEHQKMPDNILLCLQCEREIPQTPKRKSKKFCCDKCRMAWWKAHSAMIRRRSQQEFICPVCGQHFLAYKSTRQKYCSRLCYGKSKGVFYDQREIQ